jgi:hypothetical protein
MPFSMRFSIAGLRSDIVVHRAVFYFLFSLSFGLSNVSVKKTELIMEMTDE